MLSRIAALGTGRVAAFTVRYQQRARNGQCGESLCPSPAPAFGIRRGIVSTLTMLQRVSAVDQIGWAAGQAEGCCEGLPSRETLPEQDHLPRRFHSEFGCLREQITSVRWRESNPYPGRLDASTVANWHLHAVTVVSVETTQRGRARTLPGFMP